MHLLERDAVSKEAYEQVKTELATLNADIDLIEANIAQTELRAPFDGVIGLRQVSVGTYASPTTIVAKLTKISPLKVEFSVPERYANDVKIGAGVNFGLEGKLRNFPCQSVRPGIENGSKHPYIDFACPLPKCQR